MTAIVGWGKEERVAVTLNTSRKTLIKAFDGNHPTNISTTRATLTSGTPLVVISDGVKIWLLHVALRVIFSLFQHLLWNSLSY